MPSRFQPWLEFAKRLKTKVGEDDVGGGAAELAYRFFLALFPFFIFLAALGGFVASALDVENPAQELMDMIGESLPEDSSSVLERELENVIGQQNAGLLSIGILGAIWAASGGIGALVKRMNQIYTVAESRGMVARYVIAVGLTLLGSGVIVVAFVLFFAGQIYGRDIAEEVGLGTAAGEALSLARWPAAIVLVLLAVSFIYWLAPNRPMALRWVWPGALLFSLGWAVATLLFGVYVSNFGSYNATYGALGGVVVLLLWFYLTSFLILLGAEVNAVIAERQSVEGPEPGRTEASRPEGKTGQYGSWARHRTEAGPAHKTPARLVLAVAAVAGLLGLAQLLKPSQ